MIGCTTATYPSDWDPEDPLNGRAYRQQQEQENLGTSDEAAYRSSAGELARSSSNVTTSWPKYNGGTTAYIHNSENVTGKNVLRELMYPIIREVLTGIKLKHPGYNS